VLIQNHELNPLYGDVAYWRRSIQMLGQSVALRIGLRVVIYLTDFLDELTEIW